MEAGHVEGEEGGALKRGREWRRVGKGKGWWVREGEEDLHRATGRARRKDSGSEF